MSFFRNIVGTLGAKGVAVLCGLLSGMITARWLGPHDRGVLAMFMVIPTTIWMLSSFGINQANIYYIGKKNFPLSHIVSNAFVIPLASGCLICLFLWATKDQLILKYISAISPQYLFLALTLVIPMLLQNSYVGILRGVEKFSIINLREAARTIAGLMLVAMVLVIFDWGLLSVVIGIVTIEIFFSFWFVHEVNKICRIKIQFHSVVAKDVFRFGVKSYIQNMIGFLHNRIDLYLIAYFLVPSQVAFYDIAVIIGEMLMFLPQSIAFVILPKLVKGSEDEKINAATQTGRIALLITTVLGILIIFFGKWLIVIVYGQDFVGAYIPLCLLIPGIILSCLNSVTVTFYTSEHKQKVSIVASLISLLSNILLNILLIPSYGIMGAAIATSITYSMFSLLLIVIFCYENKIRPAELFFVKKADVLILQGLIAHAITKLKEKCL